MAIASTPPMHVRPAARIRIQWTERSPSFAQAKPHYQPDIGGNDKSAETADAVTVERCGMHGEERDCELDRQIERPGDQEPAEPRQRESNLKTVLEDCDLAALVARRTLARLALRRLPDHHDRQSR